MPDNSISIPAMLMSSPQPHAREQSEALKKTMESLDVQVEVTTLCVRPRLLRFIISRGIGPLEAIAFIGTISNAVLLELNRFHSLQFPSYQEIFRHPEPPFFIYAGALLTVGLYIIAMATQSQRVRSLAHMLYALQSMEASLFFAVALAVGRNTLTVAIALECQVVCAVAAAWAYLRIQREMGTINGVQAEGLKCTSPGSK